MTTRSWLLISAESGRTIRAACGGQARLDHNRTTTMRRAVFAPGQPADESLWTLRRGPERRLPEPDHPLGGAGGGSAAEQAAQLQSLDFQPAQGYYFGVPRSGHRAPRQPRLVARDTGPPPGLWGRANWRRRRRASPAPRPSRSWPLHRPVSRARPQTPQTGRPVGHHGFSGTPWHGLGIDGRSFGSGCMTTAAGCG